MILVYVYSKGVAPSGYYRVSQYLKNRDDVITHSLVPGKLYKWWHLRTKFQRLLLSPILFGIISLRVLYFLLIDTFLYTKDGGCVIIVSKFIMPHYLPKMHALLLKRLAQHNTVIWDFDDNIVATNSISKREFNLLSEYSKKIIVISDFLKSLIAPEYHNKVSLLPTTDGDDCDYDVDAVTNKRVELLATTLRIVWVATGVNLPFLEKIVPQLEQCAHILKTKYDKRLELCVICNKPLVHETDYLLIVNKQWSREVAQNGMFESHIGIMPLIDSEVTRGKGGFKLVQYLSKGLPIIGSNVGFNKEVVSPECGFLVDNTNEDLWIQSILAIASSVEVYVHMSNAAKNRYDNKFSFSSNLRFWDQLIDTNN